MADINVAYLDRLYDDLQREQMSIVSKLRSCDITGNCEKEITKQLTIYNTLLINTLRLKNLKKKTQLQSIA